MSKTKSVLSLAVLAAVAVSAYDEKQCKICNNVDQYFWPSDRQINATDRYNACIKMKYKADKCEFLKDTYACRKACNYNPNKFEMEEEIAAEAEEFQVSEEDLEDILEAMEMEDDFEEVEEYEVSPTVISPKSKKACKIIRALKRQGVKVSSKLSCFPRMTLAQRVKKLNRYRKYNDFKRRPKKTQE